MVSGRCTEVRRTSYGGEVRETRVVVRVDAEMVERLDAAVAALQRTDPAGNHSRSTVIRRMLHVHLPDRIPVDEMPEVAGPT